MRSALVAVLLLGGCSWAPVHVHGGPDPGQHLEVLMQALAAEPAEREALWQGVQRAAPGPRAALHRALLRSVPGHGGYDPAAAEAELQALLAQNPSADVVPVARARLEDLRAMNACRTEVDTLKRRLSKVADIEKRFDQERKP